MIPAKHDVCLNGAAGVEDDGVPWYDTCLSGAVRPGEEGAPSWDASESTIGFISLQVFDNCNKAISMLLQLHFGMHSRHL